MFAHFLLFTQLLFQPFTFFFSDNKPATNAGAIVWEGSRKLTWNDFQSEVDLDEPLHAMTSTNIDVKAQCYGNLMKFEVKCVFVTKDSWSKNKLSQRLLDHEQMHFDLTEVHARLLRQKLSQTTDVCGGTKRSGLDKVVNKYFADWKKEQDIYDAETNHGLDEEKQKIWVNFISKRLNDLQAYAFAK